MRMTIASCVLAVALSISGCTVAQTAQFAVARYCGLPSEARAVSREAAAIATSPNRIEINCHD